MLIDGKLILTFFETIVFFGLLGWAVDVWLRSKQVYLYPAYGLIIFGLLAVPLTYALNGFNLVAIWSVCGIIFAAGVYGVIRFGLPHGSRFQFRLPIMLISIFSLGLVILNLVQASKYAIPGGIDSAIHSSIIQGVVATADLRGTYPLGMHITIHSLEEIFQAQQELVFLSLYLLLFMSALAGLACIADRMTKRSMAGYLALAVGCIDVSLFNNYINGSGTHLVAVAFSVFLLLAAVLTVKHKRWVRLIALAGVLSIIWYFHYPTLFFALPLLWSWRLGTRQLNSWDYLIALGISLILSLPLQLKLLHDPIYVQLIGPGLAGMVVIEVILKFGYRWIQRLIWNRLILFLLASVAVWLFYYYAESFLFIPTWYGVMIIRLSLVGLFVAVLSRQPFSVFSLLAFAMMSIFYAVIHLPPIVDHAKVMIELFYYFGFTVSLILLGIAGADGIKQLMRSRRWQQVVIGVVALYAILIVTSRAFDQKHVGAILPADRPISRYESSGGFGIFYTKNDAALAAWMKVNIPDQLIVANPGGLYNAWAPLTRHPTLWATYNVLTVADPEQYIVSLKKLLRGEPGADVDLLLRRGIKYIILPEQYHVSVNHPRVKLLQQIGQARAYQLTDSVSASIYSLPIGTRVNENGIEVGFSGRVLCRYCGNAFYFTDQDTLSQLELPPTGTITITLPKEISQSGQQISVLIDHGGGAIEYQDENNIWKLSTSEKISLPQGEFEKNRVIQLRNSSTDANVYIFAVAILLTE